MIWRDHGHDDGAHHGRIGLRNGGHRYSCRLAFRICGFGGDRIRRSIQAGLSDCSCGGASTGNAVDLPRDACCGSSGNSGRELLRSERGHRRGIRSERNGNAAVNRDARSARFRRIYFRNGRDADAERRAAGGWSSIETVRGNRAVS